MGKRKVQKNAQTPALACADTSQGKEEVKGKKTYSLQESDKDGRQSQEDFPKVRISDKIEAALIDLVLEEQKNRTCKGEVSTRINTKKLTDVYNNLSDAGFSKNLVESAMTNTVMNGGDLIDALDWLCLNSQNDQLPAGFSETLMKEEEKLRPKFDVSLQKEPETLVTHPKQSGAKAKAKSGHEKGNGAAPKKSNSMKDWILQYAQDDSSDGSDLSGDESSQKTEFNPTEHYAKLYHDMQELKDQAAIAKSNNWTEKHKTLSKKLREIHLEMASFEKHPDFDKSIKATLKSGGGDSASACAKLEKPKESKAVAGKDDSLDEGFSLMFAEAEKVKASPEKTQTVKVKEDVRSFEYTRSQWTGKSPKQFLIDWVRKHLPKSGPPKYKKIQVKVNRFKCTAIVDKQKDGPLQVTPNILCENVKDAEHLASVLALYDLCKGQAVHQLLPPPYRNVWLEWMDEERKAKDDAKEKENKPRDQFISKLMKSLKIGSGKLEQSSSESPRSANVITGDGTGGSDGDEEDWESLADKEQLSDITITPKEAPKPVASQEARSKKMDINRNLMEELDKRRATSQYQTLAQTRKHLPVYQHREEIISTIRDNNVVVIAGDTGSGKSTQVPQFVLEDCLENGDSKANIICTQPRRISATSLAKRVGDEMGEGRMGPRDALVGYQIRFESRRGPNTKLVYCTTGVVLRQLQTASNLDGVSHLIIDEVHERSVQSDFLMIVVKGILRKRPNLRVILMSATMDSQKFSAYFGRCPVINIPGRTFPVEVFHLEDAIEMTGYIVDQDSPYTLSERDLVKSERAQVEVTGKGGDSSKQTLTWTKEDISKIDKTSLNAEEYSLRTRNAVTRLNLSRINLDLIFDLLKNLDTTKPFCDVEGSALVFLPGLADIQDLYEMLTTDRHFNSDRFQIFALHSVLSSEDQSKVFAVPPKGVRKIVLATNIAETGITIPDVVFVVDSGKAKENRYMESSQMSSLQETFISKANCKQRAGRAGRVRAGFCFRMFTAECFSDMKAYTTPELLRVPLEELCLNIMKCGYGKPFEFLSGALDPPQAAAVGRAMSLLKEVGACQLDEIHLTPLGHHLAALPVDVRIGKMLLFAAIFGCLEQMAVIAAAMTDKSPFVVPLSKRSEADSAKQSMAIAQSDHSTLYKAYRGWFEARTKGRSAETSYLTKNFLKRSVLIDIENVKDDLIKLIRTIGFVQPQASSSSHNSANMKQKEEILSISRVTSSQNDLDHGTIAMMKAVLTAGLYPQVGKVVTSPSVLAEDKRVCMVETSQGTAQVHPSSVNRLLDATGTWLVYHEKMKSSRIYLRDCSVVSPFALLLFGGTIDVQHTQRIVTIDGWIKFRAVAKAGVIFKELRWLLNSLLEKKLEEPSLNISDNQLIRLLKDLIKSEKSAR